MKRFPDWEKRLYEFLESHSERPFEWGRRDCALFTCDAVLAMTGVDLAAECRGRYSTREEAESLLRELSGGALEVYAAQVAERNALEPIPLQFARRGDVVLWNAPGGWTLGIVGLDGIFALFPGLGIGLERRKVLECNRAWRI